MGSDSKTLKRQRRRIVGLEKQVRKLRFENLVLQHKLEKHEPKVTATLPEAPADVADTAYDLPAYDPKADDAVDEVVNA